MSFLNHGLKEVQTGEDAADDITSLVVKVLELRKMEDVSLIDALKKATSEQGLKQISEALLEWALKKSPEKLANLFTQLSEIEKVQEDEKRSIGWPSESWAKKADGKNGDYSYGFDLEISGGLSFDIYKDGITEIDDLDSIEGFEALAKVSAHGDLKGGVNGSMNIPIGGAKMSTNAGIRRSIDYIYGYESHDHITGLAFASAMRQLIDPSDGKGLLKVFNNPKAAKLHGVVIEGDQSLGGSANVSARLPTQYGDFQIDLGGEIKTSSSFDYVITQEDVDSLSILVNSDRSRSNAASFGVSYVVGLSTIAPGAAHKLLEKVQGVHEHILKLDKEINTSLDDFEKIKNTWLKPGTLIKEKIQEELDGAFAKFDFPESIISGLGKLFGVDITDTDDFINLVQSQLTEVIAKLVDDMPDVFDLESEEISQKIIDALKDSVDTKVISMLDMDVLTKIRGMIDEKVEDLTNKFDDATQKVVNDGIKKVLDTSLDDLSDNIKIFLNKVRSISQSILDKVTQAQTDLLSAEIGWRRAVSKSVGYDYKVIFSGLSEDGIHEGHRFYKKAVISPKSFGEIIFTQSINESNYISVEDSTARYALTESKGFRWNIALLGFELGGSVNKLSEVDINQTPDGVNINMKGLVSKERSFWNETRRVSFVSVMNLYEANVRNENNELDPRTSATIKLNFEEEDKKFKLSEAEDLLNGFVDHGLLSSEVYTNIIQSLSKMHRSVNKKHVYATITIGVAIPSDVVIQMLEKVNESLGTGLMEGTGIFTGEIINSLATHDKEWVDEMKNQADSLPALGIRAEATPFEELDEEAKYQSRVEFLRRAVDSLAQLQDGGGMGVRRSRHSRHHRPSRTVRSPEDHVANAIVAFEKVLKIGAEVCFNIARPEGEPDSNEWKRIRSILKTKQKQMNKNAKKYLKTGTPVPGWGKKAPGKTMAMFAAFKNVTNKLTQVTPPLLITLKPKKGEPVSFVDFSHE